MINSIVVAINTLKLLFRKKSNIIVFLIVPVFSVLVSLTLYSNAGSGKIRLAVNDNEASILSKDLVNNLKANDKFVVSSINSQDINSSVSNGKVDCVLVIPSDFSEGIHKNTLNELQLITIKGEDTTIWIKNNLEVYIQNLMDIGIASKGDEAVFNSIYEGSKKDGAAIEVEKVQDTFTSKSVTLQSLGFLIMFMLLGATTTSNLILKEKRNRTYYRILSSPVSSKNYLIGNIIANFIIMLVQVSVVVLVATKLLKVNTLVPDLELILILMSFGLVAIGLGILIVAFSKDSFQASGLSTLIITPSCMLGGCFWDSNLMPEAIQKVSQFMPQRWTLSAISKLQTGGELKDIGINLIIILAFAAAFFLIGIYKMRINRDVKNFV